MGQKKVSILLSIKPEFADLIFNGEKTVELRRIVPKNIPNNTEIIFYASSPERCIVGKAFIKKIEAHPIKALWKKVGSKSGISFDYFTSYFEGRDIGYGLVLHKVKKFAQPYPLSTLREEADFFPPQSYMYASPKILEVLG
jgi:predicted transcriptional regulator